MPLLVARKSTIRSALWSAPRPTRNTCAGASTKSTPARRTAVHTIPRSPRSRRCRARPTAWPAGRPARPGPWLQGRPRSRSPSNSENLPYLSTPSRSSGPPAVGICLPTSERPGISRSGFATSVSSRRDSASICRWGFNSTTEDASSSAHCLEFIHPPASVAAVEEFRVLALRPDCAPSSAPSLAGGTAARRWRTVPCSPCSLGRSPATVSRRCTDAAGISGAIAPCDESLPSSSGTSNRKQGRGARPPVTAVPNTSHRRRTGPGPSERGTG